MQLSSALTSLREDLRFCVLERRKSMSPRRWNLPRALAVRTECHLTRSSLPEPDPPCRTDVRPPRRSTRARSWCATSVLYSQVIVQIRPALYGSDQWPKTHAARMKLCARHNRPRSKQYGLGL